MDTPLLAISIHEHPEPCKALEAALGDLSVETYFVKGLPAARDLIAQYQPLLVFVELAIWNRSHAEIVHLAGAADPYFNIVVVGSVPDIEMYVSAIEQGAFEFIAAPFAPETLTRVVQSAVKDARSCRESLARVSLHPVAE
jgi:DNA-binding NtrC family response regulator